MCARPGAPPSATMRGGVGRPERATPNRTSRPRPSRRGSSCRPMENPAVVLECRMTDTRPGRDASVLPTITPTRARSRGCRKMEWSGEAASGNDRRNSPAKAHANPRTNPMVRSLTNGLCQRRRICITKSYGGQEVTAMASGRPEPGLPSPAPEPIVHLSPLPTHIWTPCK